MFSSRTQTTVSLSTAEAELAALTSGVTDAMLVKSMLSELGVEVNLKACSDSSFGVAITPKRLGPDRVRHLQIKQLWIQEEVQAPGLILQHLPGSSNHGAGLGTFGMNAEEVITFVLQTHLEQAEAMVQQLR